MMRTAGVSISLVLALAGAGCGTRVTAGERSLGVPTGSAAPTAPMPAVSDTADQRDGGVSTGAVVPSGSSRSSDSPASPGFSPSGRSPVVGAGSSAGAVPGRRDPAAGTAPTRPGAPAPAPPPTEAVPTAPVAPGAKSPLLIASAGTYSGPIGAILLPGTQAVQAWVAWINDRGGLAGHPVKFLIYDDGGDPARRQAQIQEAVERRGVIAFVHNAAPFESKTTQAYITAKRIPVIGTETGTQSVYESPMYFPQATAGSGNIYLPMVSARDQLVPQGKTRLASVTCVEAQQCAEASALWAQRAEANGFTLVNASRTSITQPDYTAECLAARNAGAQVVIFALDPSSSSRLAASCVRQGYKPTFTTLASLTLDRHKEDPNLDGFIQGSNVFPYFQSGTPATDEYQQAMKTYGSRIPPGGASAVGWVAAKLLEKAGARLSEPPTSASILEGLWSLHDDTLGGLTQPLNFVRDQPAEQTLCWYNLVVRNKQWTSPDHYRLRCE